MKTFFSISGIIFGFVTLSLFGSLAMANVPEGFKGGRYGSDQWNYCGWRVGVVDKAYLILETIPNPAFPPASNYSVCLGLDTSYFKCGKDGIKCRKMTGYQGYPSLDDEYIVIAPYKIIYTNGWGETFVNHEYP